MHLSIGQFLNILAFPLIRIFNISANETHVFYALIAVNLAIYSWYIVIVIGQITSYLDIYCLSIKNYKVKP